MAKTINLLVRTKNGDVLLPYIVEDGLLKNDGTKSIPSIEENLYKGIKIIEIPEAQEEIKNVINIIDEMKLEYLDQTRAKVNNFKNTFPGIDRYNNLKNKLDKYEGVI